MFSACFQFAFSLRSVFFQQALFFTLTFLSDRHAFRSFAVQVLGEPPGLKSQKTSEKAVFLLMLSYVEASWAKMGILGHLGAFLEPSWGHLGATWDQLGNLGGT